VTLHVDGEPLVADAGEPLAASLVADGRLLLGRSVKYHRARGPVCFRGRCEGCLMRVDGVPNVMTCQVPAHDGVTLETQNVVGTARHDLLALTDWFFPEGMDHHHMFTRFGPINTVMKKVARRIAGVGRLPDDVVATTPVRDAEVDVLVVGAGEAGIIAANAAAQEGASVWLVEEFRLGGEARVTGELERKPGPPVRLMTEVAALAIYDERGVGFHDGNQEDEVRWVVLSDAEGLWRVRCRSIVLATGEEETLLAVEGGDRPGVMTPGGLLVLLSWGVAPESVALAGSGELLGALRARLDELALPAFDLGPAADGGLKVGGDPEVTHVKTASGKQVCEVAVIAGPTSAVYELASQAGANVRWADGFVVEADDEGVTAHPRAFAVGTCTGRRGRFAARQAEAAGRRAAS